MESWTTLLGTHCKAVYEVKEQFAKPGIVLIVDEFNEEVFRNIRKRIARTWKKQQFIAFTDHEIRAGADVFAIEWLTIKTIGNLIEGENLLSEIKIHNNHLRGQLEYELRSKLLDLRQNLIMDKSNRTLARFLRSGVITIIPLLRALIVLKGHSPVGSFNELCDDVHKSWEIDCNALSELPTAKSKHAEELAHKLRIWFKAVGNAVNDIQLE